MFFHKADNERERERQAAHFKERKTFSKKVGTGLRDNLVNGEKVGNGKRRSATGNYFKGSSSLDEKPGAVCPAGRDIRREKGV